jgi:CRP/FNR family transcriptional regulator, nitrogen oxide reductase regulator
MKLISTSPSRQLNSPGFPVSGPERGTAIPLMIPPMRRRRGGLSCGESRLDRSLIAASPAFANVGSEGLDEALAQARPLRLPKGIAAFGQGQKADAVFLMLDGRLRVTRLMRQGQQMVVRFVGPGDMLGDAPAINSEIYLGTATAVVDSVLLVWQNAAWTELMLRHPHLAINAMKSLGSRLQDSQIRILEMSTQQVENRIANAILRLASQAGRYVENGILIGFPISRQEIAELTGTTLHTVSRILSAWSDKGMVEGGRQRILVRDMPGLALLAKRSEA